MKLCSEICELLLSNIFSRSIRRCDSIYNHTDNRNCEGCLTVHLPREIILNASLMQQGNFIDVFLARHVFGYIRPSSGALDVELQRMVLFTEFLDGWWS